MHLFHLIWSFTEDTISLKVRQTIYIWGKKNLKSTLYIKNHWSIMDYAAHGPDFNICQKLSVNLSLILIFSAIILNSSSTRNWFNQSVRHKAFRSSRSVQKCFLIPFIFSSWKPFVTKIIGAWVLKLFLLPHYTNVF